MHRGAEDFIFTHTFSCPNVAAGYKDFSRPHLSLSLRSDFSGSASAVFLSSISLPFIKRKECGPSSARWRNFNPACATHFHLTSQRPPFSFFVFTVYIVCLSSRMAVSGYTSAAGVTHLPLPPSCAGPPNSMSSHLREFACDVSQRSFNSFVVIAGLTLVVITLGCFLQLWLIKHVAL